MKAPLLGLTEMPKEVLRAWIKEAVCNEFKRSVSSSQMHEMTVSIMTTSQLSGAKDVTISVPVTMYVETTVPYYGLDWNTVQIMAKSTYERYWEIISKVHEINQGKERLRGGGE